MNDFADFMYGKWKNFQPSDNLYDNIYFEVF